MKVLMSKFSLVVRLSIAASALLLSQQVFATGTTAGDTVNNTATVSWSVGGNPQTPFNAVAPSFLVDRRVDFTVGFDGVSEVVNPGDIGITFTFQLAHTGNSQLDFGVTVANLPAGLPNVNGFDDTGADVSNLSPLTFYYDDIDPDLAAIDIVVTGDAALALANADVANISVTVTAYDPAGNSGAPVPLADTDGVADDPTEIDNVFATLNGSAVEVVYDGMYVESAALAISKASATYWDPINLLVAPKAIPLSITEYTVSIANTGPIDATGITISDDILAPSLLIDDSNNLADPGVQPYGAGTGNVRFFDGTTTTYCIAEVGGGDGNADGCFLTGTVLTIAPVAPTGPIDVGATTGTMDISFRVSVP